MRTLFSSLLLGVVLFTSAPIVSYAATGYFEYGGVSSFDFRVNSPGGIDIVLVNRGPATWVIASGRLPNGVFLINRGGDSSRSLASIQGTATEEGVFPVRILAMVDTTPHFLDFTVNSFQDPLTIHPLGVAQGRVGLPYLQPLEATGSIMLHGVRSWTISSGTLPPGLQLNETTGEIYGTPAVAGTYQYLVEMREMGGFNRPATPREYIHTIQPASVVPVQITTRTAPVSGRVGEVYPAQIFRATGGSGAYRWAITSGTLPAGLTLDATSGILSGTPSVAGTATLNLKAYDLASETNSDAFTFSINIAAATIAPTPTPTPTPTTPTVPGTPTFITTSVPQGTVGASYSTTLTASGGTTPYSWNFASGVLPPGLSLSANGVMSGTPTLAGTYTAHIEVFGANGVYAGRSLTFTIAAATTVPTPTPAPTPTPTPTPTPAPSNPSPTASAELTARLSNLSRIGVAVHALAKLPDDGNRFTQEDSAVYYIGADGRRHAFPNDRIFFSWYSNFDGVRVVSASDLASIPLGANATYRPGVKMVKFTTDPKVYAIAQNRTLRWVKTEAAAIALYGSDWNRQIDDLADTSYVDYNFGADINVAADYDRAGLNSLVRYVSDVLPL